MTTLWRDSDPSDDDGHPDGQATRKRSSRACDQCRKTKSKCERFSPEIDQCKSCAATGTACTYLGPSYKRGPPKGYIHAIEQRWHQVESLLGTILTCPDPRAQSLIADLKQDPLAREILSRVDSGPFGPSGRRNQPGGTTKEDFFASILRGENESSPARDAGRSRRQSRISREIVSSNQDPALLTVPTLEWQDNLSNRLASANYSSSSGDPTAFPSHNPSTYDTGGTPMNQRRRLDANQATVPFAQPDWNDMYTMESNEDDSEFDASTDAADGVGQLSLDENQEVRYHGKASGLHLLSRADRSDERKDGGIWRLPMARVWPMAKDRLASFLSEDDVPVTFPPTPVQDRLVELYFAHVHPSFPVLHKAKFMSEFNRSKFRLAEDYQKSPSPQPHTRLPESSQTVSKVLLLSMFAIAARYCEEPNPPPAPGKMWEVGCDYLNDAREVLTRVFHRSQASTCQALLLLGHREFGIGSMEQGWLYIGMGIRMALDLGLNRNADKWKIQGKDLFSAEEKQVRKQIWWICCSADKCASLYMGRPVAIHEGDYDTPLPVANAEEENEPWRPLTYDTSKLNYPPVPGRIFSCFCADARLGVIVGSTLTQLYPVRNLTRTPRRTILSNLEMQLDQWYIDLPDDLRYDPASKRVTPPPHILFLHIRYWAAVLLLHRAFMPNWKGSEKLWQGTETDTTSLKAFDLCQGAAGHISTIATSYHEKFSLKCSPPSLSSYLLGAGIMHVVTLTLRPSNLQASLGLQSCLNALKEMEIVWPSAQRAWDLLHGAKVRFDSALTPGPDRHKRPAEDAFGQEKASDYLQREAFSNWEQAPASPGNGVQDLTTRIMAHMLGLDVPGVEASTSYYPGYEWWPRSGTQSPQPVGTNTMTPSSLAAAVPHQSNGAPVTFDAQPGMEDWLQGASSDQVHGYNFDFSNMPNHFGL
ncbi:hypothetical protein PLICRDRAFT_35889 [Plicaturopsis crispa FD-325 SS-3]|nr:hypothetical protein PLICRDRAFT_35889 [Plicaturopsis crispa FD-325 SS-3]